MASERPHLSRVLETVLYFTEQQRAAEFYQDVLGMKLLDREPGRSLFFRAGDSVDHRPHIGRVGSGVEFA